MAMWNPSGFKKVLSKPDANAAGGLPVAGAWDIEVIQELPPAAGAGGAAGQPQHRWLKVRAYSPDGETIQEGFMLQEWLKPAEIDRNAFVRACLSAAQDIGTNAEFLLAFADMVSKIRNPPEQPSTAVGPFQFTQEMWNEALAADPDLGLQSFDRFRPYLQPIVAASIAARAEKSNPQISAAHLAAILLFGKKQADKLVGMPRTMTFDVALREAFKDHPLGSALADLRLKEDPAQLFKKPGTNEVRSLADLIDRFADKLTPVFERAEEAIGVQTNEESDKTAPSPAPVADRIGLSGEQAGPGLDQLGSVVDRLDLGVNEVYREEILFAADRTKFAAAALAALIDAEAAKGKSGLWDPLSDARPLSSALGLTQFLKDTWIGEAKRAGTFLREKTSQLSQSALLALRTNPLHAITAAAEYAVANLAQLAKQGITPASLAAQAFPLTPKNHDEDWNKAKLAYLAHHEGVSGALDVIRGTLPEGRAQKLLRSNNPKKADALRAQAGSWNKAYINWLFGYINSRIVPSKFLAAESGGADAPGGLAGGAGSTGAPVPGAAGAAAPPPKLTVKASNPGLSVATGGALKLAEAHLIGLWRRSAFPIDASQLVVFGIRGCLPAPGENFDFASEHKIEFSSVNYKTMNCTLGQWQPSRAFAVFPGSTVPFLDTVKSGIAAGGRGVNQFGPGRYPRYRAGFHKRKEGRAGHWALLQECPITIQRTADDADFDLEDRWEVGQDMGDNIHCAFHVGPQGAIANSRFSSAGCQTVAGTVKKGVPGSAGGPWAKFIASFEPGKQSETEYVLFPGAELQEMMQDQCRGKNIILRMGSQGDLVKELQHRLSAALGQVIKDDGEFGPTTFKAVIKFQTSKFGNTANDGIVDTKMATALGFELPFFDFEDAIGGGTGQSKNVPVPR
jgi:hypothetical protein